jgi:hypothetical protein
MGLYAAQHGCGGSGLMSDQGIVVAAAGLGFPEGLAQTRFVDRLPNRMQAGVVQRIVNRQTDVYTDGPGRATPAPDLRHRRLDIAGADADHRLESVRVFAAEVVQIAIRTFASRIKSTAEPRFT